MKYLLFLFSFVFLSLQVDAFAQNLPKVKNTCFTLGETLKFKLYYNSALTGNVLAGEMTSKVQESRGIIEGDTVYNIKVAGKTKGAFRWFYKVEDEFQTYVDQNALIPRLFRKKLREEKYRVHKEIRFYHEDSIANSKNLKDNSSYNVAIIPGIQDIVSSIYFARTFNADTLKMDDAMAINFFLDDSIYQSKLVYKGVEKIETSMGEVECLKFKPTVLTGGVFKDEDKLVVYISNDKNHLPIMAESEVLIGSVRMELVGYSNLRNPFTSLVKI